MICTPKDNSFERADFMLKNMRSFLKIYAVFLSAYRCIALL